MSQAQAPRWTMESFLAWEARQTVRWEFDGIRPVAMTGGTFAHEVVQGNVIRAVNNRLTGGRCRAVGPNLKVQAGLSIRYPDVAVTCSPMTSGDLFLAMPLVIFEVLSPSTAEMDRTVKLSEYKAISSVFRYVMLEQNSVFATVITRTDEGWRHLLVGRGGTLDLPELGIEVPMSELYDGLTLDEPSSGGES